VEISWGLGGKAPFLKKRRGEAASAAKDKKRIYIKDKKDKG
jgi:hypothetical protein